MTEAISAAARYRICSRTADNCRISRVVSTEQIGRAARIRKGPSCRDADRRERLGVEEPQK